MRKLPVVVLVGPTCTGKTALSLALAQKFGGAVVACDSRTVYRGMDIGTAKPTRQEQKEVPHFMLDVLEPTRFYSVAEYKEEASVILGRLLDSQKLPIVCGGTGLYARALLEGMAIPEVPPQKELRAHLASFADEHGNAALHNKLANLDVTAANRLHENDRVRVIRAIEVSMAFGKPFSEVALRIEPPFPTIWLGLTWQDRTKHRKVISQRLAQQIEDGLLTEVKTLFENDEYVPVLKQAVNYKEFAAYLTGGADLAAVQQECILHNFQLARKQMIWFRANKKINWFAVDELSFSQITREAIRLIGAGED